MYFTWLPIIKKLDIVKQLTFNKQELVEAEDDLCIDNANKLITITGYTKDSSNNKLEQERLQDAEHINYNAVLDILNNKTVKTLATCPLNYKIKIRHLQVLNTHFNNAQRESCIVITET